MFTSRTWLPWVAAIVVMVVAQEAQALVIDDFTQGAVTMSDPLGIGSVSDLKTGLDPAHTAATARHIGFNAIDPFPTGDSGQVTVQVDTTGVGILQQLPDPGLSAANLFISYGRTRLGLPSMSLDWSARGADRLAFDFLSAVPDPALEEPRTFLLDMLLKFGSGISCYSGVTVPFSTTPFTLTVTFDQLIDNLLPSQKPLADFSDVVEFQFGTSNGVLQGSVALDAVRTVPEPLAMTMASCALLFVLTWRCR